MTINRTILKILPFIFLGFLLAQEVDVANYDCEDCHGEEGWEILEFEFFSHNETRFPLQGNHSLLEYLLDATASYMFGYFSVSYRF